MHARFSAHEGRTDTDRPATFMSATRRAFGWIIPCVIALAGCLFLCWNIYAASANVPLSDTWAFVPVIGHYLGRGDVSWRSLWTPDGQDRPVLWRLALLASARYDSFNLQELKLLAPVAVAVEYVVLYRDLQGRLSALSLRAVTLLLLPPAILLFSLTQWETFTEEWNTANACAVACAVIAIVLLDRSRSWRYRRTTAAAAIVLGVVGPLLGEPGILVWPAFVFLLILRRREFSRLEQAVVVAAAAGFLVGYLSGVPGGASVTTALGSHPAEVAEFFLICLGSSAMGTFHNAVILVLDEAVGGFLLVGAVVAAIGYTRLDPGGRRECSPYLTLMVLGLFECGGPSVARLSFGLGSAASSRYVTSALLVPLGTYLVVSYVVMQRWTENRRAKGTAKPALRWRVRPELCALLALATCFIVGVGVIGDGGQLTLVGARKNYFESAAAVVMAGRGSAAQLGLLEYSGGPDSDQTLLDDFAILRLYHLSVFARREGAVTSLGCAATRIGQLQLDSDVHEDRRQQGADDRGGAPLGDRLPAVRCESRPQRGVLVGAQDLGREGLLAIGHEHVTPVLETHALGSQSGGHNW